jgi:prepilin signal peptidase PulO-like enzyme (type II secretory pathway)
MDVLELSLKIISTFVLGMCIGSFINCLIWRRNNNMRITNGRSQCVHCGRTLRWYENIPVLSFLFLRGRCRTCLKPIPKYYVIVEFFTGILFLLVYWLAASHYQNDWVVLTRDLFFLSILMIIFVEDCVYQTIQSEIIWLGIVGGFIFNYFLGVPILNMVIGAAIGCGFFLIQYIISKGRWIGGGDVRMGAMMGVWLCAPVVIFAIFAAYILGAFVSIILLLGRKRGWGSAIPFGPFLAFSTFLALFYGQFVVDWYLRWLI